MPEYDPHYKEEPVFAKVVGKVVVVNKKGELLFLQRSEKCTRPHEWDLIGGGLELGEEAYESMKREAYEETQLKIINIRPVYVSSFMSKNGEFLVMIGYKAEIVDERTPILSWEHEKFKWVSPREAVKVALPEFHATTVKKALES